MSYKVGQTVLVKDRNRPNRDDKTRTYSVGTYDMAAHNTDSFEGQFTYTGEDQDSRSRWFDFEYYATVQGSNEDDSIIGTQSLLIDVYGNFNPWFLDVYGVFDGGFTNSYGNYISRDERYEIVMQGQTLYGNGGNDHIVGSDIMNTQYEGYLGGQDTLHGGTGNDWLEGGTGDDELYGDADNDTLEGGGGNDTLEGGTGNDWLEGGAGNDTLDGGSDSDGFDYDYGYFSGDGDFKATNSQVIRGANTEIDTISNLEAIYLEANAWNNTLDASEFDGDSLLEGGSGNDTLYGSKGTGTAVFNGSREDFLIHQGVNNSLIVTDNEPSNGHDGEDTLYDIDQLIFQTDDVKSTFDLATNRITTINVVAGTSDIERIIKGDNGGPTQYILGVQGSTGAILNFDSQKLANFINAITLPDQDIEDTRFARNAILTGAGVVGDFVPGVGTVFDLLMEGFNYDSDSAQVEAQIEAAQKEVQQDDPTTWGEISKDVRDLIVIDDFQVGVDTIVLPTAQSLFFVEGIHWYEGQYQNGVYIRSDDNDGESAFAFIRNNEKFSASDDGYTLKDILKDMRNGYTISAFNQQVIEVAPNNSSSVLEEGTYAGDVIKGLTGKDSPQNDEGGRFQLVGQYGDDILQGAAYDDFLYGGFKTVDHTPSILAYDHDGSDRLEGKGGDDLLDGGSGNDTLDGGSGNDILRGGEGADSFVFNAVDGNVDTVEDFNANQGDIIQIDVKAFHDAFPNASLSYSYDSATNTVELSIAGQPIAKFENISSDEDVANLLKQIEFVGSSHKYSNNWVDNITDILIGDASDQGLSEGWGKDYIYGGAGNDTIWGGHHQDVLLGGDGHDVITGAGHADTIIGGKGADTFKYGQNAWDTRGSGGDLILDFSGAGGEGDKIEIAASVWGISDKNQITANQVQGGTDVLVAGTKIAHLMGFDAADFNTATDVELFVA
ncbi:MAG: calcium-binding protein [Cyanobacteria bacterium P01_D01_bin.6]